MKYDIIVEVSREIDLIEEVEKFNPYHDAKGRFATANSHASFTYSPGKSKAHDLAIAREKERQNTQESSEHRIAEMLGVEQDKIRLGDLPQKSKESICNGVEMTLKQFPELKGNITGIEYDENLDSWACTYMLTGKIKVGPFFKDYEKMAKKYERDVKIAEFHPKGTDADSIIVHEMGHVLDGMLTKAGAYGGSISQNGVWKSSGDIMQTVSSRVGLDKMLQQHRKDYAAQGYKGSDLTHAVKFERREWFSKNVSGYAAENSSEFFAECFTELVASKNPRQTAKVFAEELKKAMGEMK